MSLGWSKSKERGMARRAFLGGAGTVVALPFLESLLPRQARAVPAELPKRLIYYFLPNGMVMDKWKPTTTGTAYTMPPILTALEHLRSDFMIVSGLANAPAVPEGLGDHGAGTSAFATAAHAKKSESDLKLGLSADQIAATALGKNTKVPSLPLGNDAGSLVGGCDNGYGCAYSNSISWAGISQPLTKIVNPAQAFNLLFMGFDPSSTKADQAKRLVYRKSVLDHAIGHVQSLNPRLGTTDRSKLDQYLTGVNEVERELTSTTMTAGCNPGMAPTMPDTFEKTVHLFADVMVMAMQCDVTRFFSYQFGNAASGRSYPNLSISRGHHDISHHQNIQSNIDMLQKIDTYEIQLVDYLLTKMKSTTEGTTDLLYNSTLFLSSDVSDGNTHSHNDMPVLVAGHGGGMLNTGQHIAYPLASAVTGGKKFANMLSTTLRTVGLDMPVGNSDGVLTEALKV